MNIAVPVRQRRHLSTIAMSGKKGRMNAVTTTANAIVNEKNVLDILNTAELSHPSPKKVPAQKALKQAKQTVCCVYTEKFRNLLETHKV